MLARIAGSGGSRSIATAAGLIGAFLALVIPAIARADDADGVIVRYRPGTGAAERLDSRRDAGVTFGQRLLVSRSEVVQPAAGVSDAAAIRSLQSDPDVQFAEPNLRRHALGVPNDSLFGQEWALQNTGQTVTGGNTGGQPSPGADIDAPSAWDLTTGSPSVVVGVVDTGMDMTRPDLAPNLWNNARPNSSGLSGVSNDLHGWDFVDGDNDPTDVTAPDTLTSTGNPGHGTHVSGILGARGNDGGGISGVSWNTSIMPVRVLDDHGSGTLADVLNGYRYAAREGARIVNASLGDYAPSDAEKAAIAESPNSLFIVAAGNDGGNNDNSSEPTCAATAQSQPAQCSFPCNYDLANILCVAATDRADNLASFSNFGATRVDVAAPGTDILSTLPTTSQDQTSPGSGFGLLDGTSMATPEVSGVAALVLARQPALNTAQLKQALMEGVDKLPSLDGKVASGGRINALAALQAADRLAPPPPAAAPPASPTPPVVVQSSSSAPDVAAPVLALSLGRRASVRTLLSRGLRVAVHCSEGCKLSYRVLLDAKTAKRLHRKRTAATRTHTLTKAATDSASLRLPKALRRVRSGKLTVQITAVDGAGNTVSRNVTITLRR